MIPAVKQEGRGLWTPKRIRVLALLMCALGARYLLGFLASGYLNDNMRRVTSSSEDSIAVLERELGQAQEGDQRFLEQLRQLNDRDQRIFASPLLRLGSWLMGLLGIILLIAGIGVYRLKEWGRKLAMWQVLPATAAAAVWARAWNDVLSQTRSETWQDPRLSWLVLLAVVVHAFPAWLLSRPSVKEQFLATPL